MKSITLLLSAAAAVSGYQMSNYTAPTYPVIIPAPQNLEYHNQSVNISVINPCFFAINIDTPAYYDKDSFSYVNNTVQWYVDKYIFFKGKACPAPQENST